MELANAKLPDAIAATPRPSPEAYTKTAGLKERSRSNALRFAAIEAALREQHRQWKEHQP